MNEPPSHREHRGKNRERTETELIRFSAVSVSVCSVTRWFVCPFGTASGAALEEAERVVAVTQQLPEGGRARAGGKVGQGHEAIVRQGVYGDAGETMASSAVMSGGKSAVKICQRISRSIVS